MLSFAKVSGALFVFRHIVSLLQHDDLDGEHQDIMGIASLRKGVSSAGSVNSRHRNRKKVCSFYGRNILFPK